tara:strand:- start:294 stop:515 length:222 start_codon:yes stop_codon:yes gene_type:complete
MTNINDKIKDHIVPDDNDLGFAFIKKEIHRDENFNTDIFTVYASDGTLLAAFDNRETAMAAILQSGLKYISLH